MLSTPASPRRKPEAKVVDSSHLHLHSRKLFLTVPRCTSTSNISILAMNLMHIECIRHGRLCTSQCRFSVVIREEIEMGGGRGLPVSIL